MAMRPITRAEKLESHEHWVHLIIVLESCLQLCLAHQTPIVHMYTHTLWGHGGIWRSLWSLLYAIDQLWPFILHINKVNFLVHTDETHVGPTLGVQRVHRAHLIIHMYKFELDSDLSFRKLVRSGSIMIPAWLDPFSTLFPCDSIDSGPWLELSECSCKLIYPT